MAGEKKRQRGEKKSSPVVRLPLAGGEEAYSLNASKVGSVAKVKTLFIEAMFVRHGQDVLYSQPQPASGAPVSFHREFKCADLHQLPKLVGRNPFFGNLPVSRVEI
jgi:hypothetical protein